MLRKTRSAAPQMPPRLTQVAAYARVSSGKDAMLESLSAQVSYYSAKIQSHPGWQYVGVYADEALTGTKDGRSAFQRLLADCRAGKIDLILVKSLSRLARNTVTLLATIRELKALNVDIYFEKENIHTMGGDGELLLTLIAAVAQEESRSVSENCKWRIRNDYAHGIDKSGLNVFGYSWRNGVYQIVPGEAAVIHHIFDAYESGHSIHKILLDLQSSDCPTPRSGYWTKNAIRYILGNERYIGDLLLQKEYLTDHLTKKRKTNRGELPQYYVQDAHDAIIDRAQFDRVQILLKERADKYAAAQPGVRKYPFSGILLCARCGKPYTRNVAHGIPSWNCGTYVRQGKMACCGKRIPESELTRLTKEVLGLQGIDGDIELLGLNHIVVIDSNQLQFVLKNGTTIERIWEARKRAEGWDEAARERARQHAHRRWAK